jgi:hypothetical protein
LNKPPVRGGDLPNALRTTGIPKLIEHSVLKLVSHRVYALVLGYDNLNDHDELRHDPLLAVLVGKTDPTGWTRAVPRDHGKASVGARSIGSN